jgi:predicted acyl esterase
MSLKTYYLDTTSNTASIAKNSNQSSVDYSAADMASEVTFDIIFDEYTEIAGYAKLSLWLQCHDHDDMDVYALLAKIDKHGNAVTRVNFPHQTPVEELPRTNVVQYQGPTGFLRASHRDYSSHGPSYAEPIHSGDQGSGSEWSGEAELWHPHFQSKKVPKGDIVNVQFTTWPMGVAYEKGEGMRVRISGRDMCLIEAVECKYYVELLSKFLKTQL